jgi:hypothetical protein
VTRHDARPTPEQLERRIREANIDGRATPPSELVHTAAHAGAAIARVRGTLEAITAWRREPGPIAQARVVGEASQALLAIYLAATAADRHAKAIDNPGPLGETRHAELIAHSRHMRDTLMHWDQKGGRDPSTFLNITETHVTVYAPHGRTDPASPVLADLSWKVIEDSAERLHRWAVDLLDEDVSSAAEGAD